MDILRSACADVLRNVDNDPSSIITSAALPHAHISDSSSRTTIVNFLRDVRQSRFDSTLPHRLLEELAAMDDLGVSAVSENRLIAALTFLLSIPERVAAAPSLVSETWEPSQYVRSLSCMLFHRSSSNVWRTFCRICSRRGVLGEIVPLFGKEHELRDRRLLETCDALRSANKKLVQFISAVANGASAAEWLSSVAFKHGVEGCPRQALAGLSGAPVVALQTALFDTLLPQFCCKVCREVVRHFCHEALFSSVLHCNQCIEFYQKASLVEVSLAWGLSSVYEISTVAADTVGHALTYLLLGYCERQYPVEGEPLRMILKGISDRFELLNGASRREEAARVAVLYSRCANAESDPVFDEFPNALTNWLAGENLGGQLTATTRLNSAPRQTNCLVLVTSFGSINFPVDPDRGCDLINLTVASNTAHTSANQVNDSPFAAFGSGSLAEEGKTTDTVRGIYELLSHFSADESDSSRLQRISNALCAIPRAMAENPGDDILVARIFAHLLTIDVTTRHEKVQAMKVCIACSSITCLSTADETLRKSTLSLASQVDFWDSVGHAAEFLAIKGIDESKSCNPHIAAVYPPMRLSTRTSASDGNVRWKSTRLGLQYATQSNALAQRASSFFPILVHAPRGPNTLQFADIARLRALSKIVKLLSSTPNILTNWRGPIVVFSLSCIDDALPETRSVAWELIAIVGASTNDAATRQQLRDSLHSVAWDNAPATRKSQALALFSLNH